MNRAHNLRSQQGFTLVEITLSMAFIAMLLLAIALLTIQITSVANKGFTMRAVNESGQLIVSDMQRTLSGSRPADVSIAGNSDGGRVCANGVVYAWNDAARLSDGFNRFEGAPNREVRMVRFKGASSYCRPDINGIYAQLPASSGTLTELLKSGDNRLAIHNLTIAPDPDDNSKYGSAVAGDDTQRIYSIAFTLGTSELKVINDESCAEPENRTEDEYCAVNAFQFTARAGGKGVSDAGN